MTRKVKIKVPDYDATVTGILNIPDKSQFLMVLAHGAGAGMEHDFMEGLAAALSLQNIATHRYNFIYMESGSKRPDSPAKAIAAIKAAIGRARQAAVKHKLVLLGGGKSFGGRMFSKLLAEDTSLPIKGMVFFGFPLHAAGRPSTERAAHLRNIKVPMLFLQGTRDILADNELIAGVASGLRLATLSVVEGTDHGFHMLKKSGISDREVIADLSARTLSWSNKL